MKYCRNLILIPFSAAAVLWIASGTAQADMDAVNAALDRGDNVAALEELRPLADQGEADAQVLLGDLYFQGIGLPANYSLAWTWYNRAALNDDPIGQYKLGKMYWDGIGVPRDDTKAVEWYESAAAGGHVQAQIDLGYIYRDGRRDILARPSKALEYFRMAGDQGNDEALIAIEEMFASGLGPADAVAEYEAEQESLSLSEPERIQRAVEKWLAAINVGDPNARPPNVVVTEAEDKIQVVVPDLVLKPAAGTEIIIGTVQAILAPVGELPDDPDEDMMLTRRYEVDLQLPTRIGIRDDGEEGEITFETVASSGLFLPAIANFAEIDLHLTNLALTNPDGITIVNADMLRWYSGLEESTPNLWGGPSSFEIGGVAMADPEGGIRVNLGRAYAETHMTDIDLQAYYNLAKSLGLDPTGPGGPVDLRPEIDTLVDFVVNAITSTTFVMGLETLEVYENEQTRIVSIDSMTFGADTHQENPRDVELRLRYSHDGLEAVIPDIGPLGSLVPTTANLELAGRQIPLEQMVRSGVETLALVLADETGAELSPEEKQQAMMVMLEFGPNTMMMLEQAKAKLGVDADMVSVLSALALAGELGIDSNAAFGTTGSFNLTISDLPAIIALVEGDPELAQYGPLVKAFDDIAERDAAGGDARFAIDITTEGTVMVNGQDAIAMSMEALVE